MVQINQKGDSEYVSIPSFTKDKTERARLYRLVREHRLVEGEEYKIIERKVEVILVKKTLKLNEKN